MTHNQGRERGRGRPGGSCCRSRLPLSSRSPPPSPAPEHLALLARRRWRPRAAPLPSAARRPATALRLLPASQVWLDGKTNVVAWQCVGDSLRAELSIDAPAAELETRLGDLRQPGDGARHAQGAAGGEVPGDRVSLRAAQRSALPPRGSGAGFRAAGRREISLAGTSRSVAIDVTATQIAPQRFRLRGGLPLRTSDFGIQPPVALLGLWTRVALHHAVAQRVRHRLRAVVHCAGSPEASSESMAGLRVRRCVALAFSLSGDSQLPHAFAVVNEVDIRFDQLPAADH